MGCDKEDCLKKAVKCSYNLNIHEELIFRKFSYLIMRDSTRHVFTASCVPLHRPHLCSWRHTARIESFFYSHNFPILHDYASRRNAIWKQYSFTFDDQQFFGVRHVCNTSLIRPPLVPRTIRQKENWNGNTGLKNGKSLLNLLLPSSFI